MMMNSLLIVGGLRISIYIWLSRGDLDDGGAGVGRRQILLHVEPILGGRFST